MFHFMTGQGPGAGTMTNSETGEYTTRFTVGLRIDHTYHPFHCWAENNPSFHPFHCWAEKGLLSLPPVSLLG